MRIVIGADHAGFALKRKLGDYLRELGHAVIDLGTMNQDPVDYPDYAEAVAKAVLQGQAERGVLICGSGVGASVAANKLPGIRAAVCHDTYSARQGVEHDDMNILVFGARIIGEELARELVRAFLAARFTAEERHLRGVEKIKALEKRYGNRVGRNVMNPLKELLAQGQSVWLDYIRRDLIRTGELKRLVEEDGIRGVTSNPTIFEKAIAGSTDYDEALRALLAKDPKTDLRNLYERLAIEDIQMAADVLRGVYDETGGADGYVSFEVSPHLAHDTQGTIKEAKRLRAAVARPNVMIKVPGDSRGNSRHRRAHRRGSERQHYFDVLHASL